MRRCYFILVCAMTLPLTLLPSCHKILPPQYEVDGRESDPPIAEDKSKPMMLADVKKASVKSPKNKSQSSLRNAIESSDLIFRGKVVDVQYSMRGSNAHTHVEYLVLDVIKGNLAETSFEISLQGGPLTGKKFQFVKGQPLINKGDHDIVMVGLKRAIINDQIADIQSVLKRGRILNKFVYNEFGRAYMQKNEASQPYLARKAVDHKLFQVRKLGKRTIKRKAQGKDKQTSKDLQLESTMKQMRVGEFVDFIKSITP